MKDASISALDSSTLASIRYRLAPMAKASAALGYHVSIGDRVPAEIDILIVGKIGGGDYDRRSALWLDGIRECLSKRTQVIIDYTDHHCEAGRPFSSFYQQLALQPVFFVVPSNSMKAALREFLTGQPITVIEDLLEYKVVRPKAHPVSDVNKAMWLGHESNLPFLEQFLVNVSQTDLDFDLTILSSKAAYQRLVEWVPRQSLRLPLKFIPWSVDAVFETSKNVDFSIIPSDLNSAKRHASNNRLISSLALGVPVAATPLPSYEEFIDYFIDIECFDQFSRFARSPWTMAPKIAEFQQKFVGRFSNKEITLSWARYLSDTFT